MNPGLVLVVVPTPDLVPLVRRALERQAILGVSHGGLPAMRPLPLTSMYGLRHDKEIGRALAASPPLGDDHIQTFRVVRAGHPASIYSPEGLHQFLARIRRCGGRWFTWAEHGRCDPTALTLALNRLRARARKSGARVMIFLCRSEALEGINLLSHCDLNIEVLDCDPEPRYQRGFIVRAVGHDTLWLLGQNAATWSFRWRNGCFEIHRTQYLSVDLLNRYIWMLRCAGETVPRIGNEVGLSACAVSLRLAAMPSTEPLDLSEQRRATYRDALGLGG